MITELNLRLRYYAPPIPDWRENCWTCIDDLTNDYDAIVGIGPTPLSAVIDYYDQILDHNLEIAPGFMRRLPSGEEYPSETEMEYLKWASEETGIPLPDEDPDN